MPEAARNYDPDCAKRRRATRNPVITGESAEQQLNALAKRIAGERRMTYPQAYVEALNSTPALYSQYLKEHEAALGASRG